MSQSNKKVAVIGTVGVPAQYGGFETLVENIIGENASPEVHYTIFCSSKAYKKKLVNYKGAILKYVPLNANGAQSVLYDICSILRAICSKNDVLLILGVSGALILPIVRIISNKKLIVNIDGLEHRREKWSKWIRLFLKWSEKISVRFAHIVVTDNKAIQDYVAEEYARKSVLIAYGGNHVLCDTSTIEDETLVHYKLKKGNYACSICRIEPENNVHLTLEAFAAMPEQELVFVGNWHNSEYGRTLWKQYNAFQNIHLFDPIYDTKILNVLRRNAKVYIHGHSAGGTNPSLVEAMFFCIPILAYDVSYNRETTEYAAQYYTSIESLIQLLRGGMVDSGAKMVEIACRRYQWSIIAKQYEELYEKVM